jgi:hypothetical protein
MMKPNPLWSATALRLILARISGDPKRAGLAAADSLGGRLEREQRRLDARTPSQVRRDDARNRSHRAVWIEGRKYFKVDLEHDARQIVALCQRAVSETLETLNTAVDNMDLARGSVFEERARAEFREAVAAFALAETLVKTLAEL